VWVSVFPRQQEVEEEEEEEEEKEEEEKEEEEVCKIVLSRYYRLLFLKCSFS
jgi:hypothetical protein